MDRWQLKQFRSASGREVISDWRRKDLSPGRRSGMDLFLKRIVTMPDWPSEICKPLKGHTGYWELRWTSEKVEHRILGYKELESFVMLVGCTHKQRVYDPHGAFQILRDRISKLERKEATICDYPIRTTQGDEGEGL
jgi:hypothetical protein